MRPLPHSNQVLVIRTDFSDDRSWSAVRTAIAAPVGEFRAYVDFVDDREFDGLTVERLLRLSLETESRAFVFIVDSETLRRPDYPVLVVDLLGEKRGRSFRVVPSAAWSVENNLSIANMDWEDFSESADPDGVFRGFQEFE